MRIWRKGPIIRNYVSNFDRFLLEFDQKPEASSASRRAEEVEYANLNRLRDNPAFDSPCIQIWEDF
jgi:hypothetical protein